MSDESASASNVKKMVDPYQAAAEADRARAIAALLNNLRRDGWALTRAATRPSPQPPPPVRKDER